MNEWKDLKEEFVETMNKKKNHLQAFYLELNQNVIENVRTELTEFIESRHFWWGKNGYFDFKKLTGENLRHK